MNIVEHLAVSGNQSKAKRRVTTGLTSIKWPEKQLNDNDNEWQCCSVSDRCVNQLSSNTLAIKLYLIWWWYVNDVLIACCAALLCAPPPKKKSINTSFLMAVMQLYWSNVHTSIPLGFISIYWLQMQCITVRNVYKPYWCFELPLISNSFITNQN